MGKTLDRTNHDPQEFQSFVVAEDMMEELLDFTVAYDIRTKYKKPRVYYIDSRGNQFRGSC